MKVPFTAKGQGSNQFGVRGFAVTDPFAAKGDATSDEDTLGRFIYATLQIARNEFLQLLRTKRLLVAGILIMISLIGATIILPLTLFEMKGANDLAWQNLAFVAFLNLPLLGGLFFLQILSITLPADSVCSEWQRKTLFLVLSKPVPRRAWVLGKFIGILLPLIGLFMIVFLLDYTLTIMILDGVPSWKEFGWFLNGMFLISLGMLAFGAMALFFSTLTRSTAGSMIFSLAFAFLLFPLVGSIGDIAYGVDQSNRLEPDANDWKYDWSHYMNPASAMLSASPEMSDGEFDLSFIGVFPQNAPARTWLSAVASLTFAGAFLTGALAIVTRRDFE